MCHLRNSMHHTGVFYYELQIFAVACLSLVNCLEYVTIFWLGKKYFAILKLQILLYLIRDITLHA